MASCMGAQEEVALILGYRLGPGGSAAGLALPPTCYGNLLVEPPFLFYYFFIYQTCTGL